ncbi:hypothetical protein O1Q96_25790 [Streptomyces sp. Qhu-G9]|uniref:hypothetical protein n=1 Tax=Streptomyces sp. Qhu-G9 TaxID=3452799 RepID=UPI0022AC0656|nr:hypothetical protein [Streptomyces aurantiacus]WAU82808.1 hypothetical protein O1Q96_25790 [Streptomyces aurantiacus]
MERTGRAYGELMYLVLTWDVSRCAGPDGLRLTWREDTGWSHTLLRAGAGLRFRRFSSYDADWYGEWKRAREVRTAIDAFRQPAG